MAKSIKSREPRFRKVSSTIIVFCLSLSLLIPSFVLVLVFHHSILSLLVSAHSMQDLFCFSSWPKPKLLQKKNFAAVASLSNSLIFNNTHKNQKKKVNVLKVTWFWLSCPVRKVTQSKGLLWKDARKTLGKTCLLIFSLNWTISRSQSNTGLVIVKDDDGEEL